LRDITIDLHAKRADILPAAATAPHARRLK
jgi:hypothetical protein